MNTHMLLPSYICMYMVLHVYAYYRRHVCVYLWNSMHLFDGKEPLFVERAIAISNRVLG